MISAIEVLLLALLISLLFREWEKQFNEHEAHLHLGKEQKP